MAKHKASTGDNNLEHIEETLTRAELFIEKHQKNLLYGGLALLILVGGYFAYKYWYRLPLEEEAQSQMFVAVQSFEKDSLQTALNGDGTNLGLLEVADRYSGTAAGNLASYYAGVAYLHLGQYEDAISYLEKFSGHGLIGKALAIGNIGDAYSELGSLDKAVAYYKKAAGANANQMTSPRFLVKAGVVYEKLEDYKSALAVYQQLQKDYPTTTEGRDAEKYITRVQVKMEQR
ncbi:MAG: tetratricopeptide repeat protein [Prevotellaceae bacterium]|jgi:tetratricopeptide (TPR) repeat protein|nr:tetratricopeptide repeat protein [Prevotellaceae bacterium]